MTVTSEVNRVSFSGNGSTRTFATTPIVFFEASNLKVYRVDADGVETLQTITTHYSVTGGAGSTGSVVTVFTAPVTESVLIVRDMPITQQDDFVNNDPSDAEVAEDALDRIVMIAQQLQEQANRAVRVPIGSSLTGLTMPADFTGKAGYRLVVNATEDGIDLVAP